MNVDVHVNNFNAHNLKRLMNMKIKSMKKDQESMNENKYNYKIDSYDKDMNNEYNISMNPDYKFDQDDVSFGLLEKDDTSLIDLSQFIERSYTSFSPMRKHTPYFFGVYDPNATIRFKHSSSFDSLSTSTLEDDDLESNSSDMLHITYPFQKNSNNDSSDYDILYDNLCEPYSSEKPKKSKHKNKAKVKDSSTTQNQISKQNNTQKKSSNKKTKSELTQKKSDSDDIWNVEGSDERKRVLEFWLSLSQEERNKLIRLEKESVTKKMKEQQKHSCTCSVCGRRRALIEEELELLYDAYYEELERYTKHNGDLSDHELFKNIGSSNNMINIADDLMKNEGKKFVQMMERLADRKIRKDVADHSDHASDSEDTNDRLEKAKSMFQLFAAKMFEQRILTAYREKVALEKQKKLIEEEEERDKLAQQKKESRQRKRDRKKMKKKQKQIEEERKKKEEEERIKKEQEEKLRKKEEQKKHESDSIKHDNVNSQDKPEQQKKEEDKTSSKKKKRKNKGKLQQTQPNQQVQIPLEPPKEPPTAVIPKTKTINNTNDSSNSNKTNTISNDLSKSKSSQNNSKPSTTLKSSKPTNDNLDKNTTKNEAKSNVNSSNDDSKQNSVKVIDFNEVPNLRTTKSSSQPVNTQPKDPIFIPPSKTEPKELNRQRMIQFDNFYSQKTEEIIYKQSNSTIVSKDDEVIVAPRRDEIEVYKRAVIAFETLRKYLIEIKLFSPILARDIWEKMVSIDITLEYDSSNSFNPVSFLFERSKKGYAYIDLITNSPGLYSTNPDISCLNDFYLIITTKKQPCLVCDKNPGVELMTPCNHLVCSSCLSSYKSSLQPIGQQPTNIEIKYCIVCKKSVESKFSTSNYNLFAQSKFFPTENQFPRLYNPFDEKPNYQNNNLNNYINSGNTYSNNNNFWNYQNINYINDPMVHLNNNQYRNNLYYNNTYTDNSMFPINVMPKIQ